jgi:single-stranded-DNA-specific exonuclease
MIAALPDLHPLLAQIVHHRGIGTVDGVQEFFGEPELKLSLLGKPGVNKAIARVRFAIRRGDPVVVYGDFDVDGVTATAVLMETLRGLGANVRHHIPHRVDEGYGLNVETLQELADEGAKLVITVDCGIRSVEEIRAANASGLDIIITDHHSIGPELPPALAIINAKRPDWGLEYPDTMLAGVGTAFKFAEALLMVHAKNGRRGDHTPEIRVEDLLDLVALGTVADLVPLLGENRALVRRGLEALRHSKRPGIQMLAQIARVDLAQVNAMHIGFMLGPRLNAAGRLEHADLAYHLLSTPDPEVALQLADELDRINVERQEHTRIMQSRAEELALAEDADVPILIAADADFMPGVVGLAAGRLTESFYRPSVVIQKGKEESHGSCRSIPEFDITAALDECADLFVRYGGHAAAAGFTIANENLSTFRERLLALGAERLGGRDLHPRAYIDAVIPAEEVDFALFRLLQKLEPCGQGNPRPLLMTPDLAITAAHRVGSEGSHLKLRLAAGKRTIEAIAFRKGDWLNNLPARVDVAYELEINEWRGTRTLQFNVQDMRAAESD